MKFARIGHGPLFRRSPRKKAASPPNGSPTGMWRAWSSRPRWRRASAAISPKASARANSAGHSLRAGLA